MQHIILSPHYDDAALSCGGLIAQRAAAGDLVEIATVFGGRPDMATLSPFARAIHARPGATADLIALFDQRDAKPAREQPDRGREPAESRSDNDDVFGHLRFNPRPVPTIAPGPGIDDRCASTRNEHDR